MKSSTSKKNKLTKATERSIILTQEQIKTLYEIAQRFNDVPQFVIEERNQSGIGQSTHVKFDLFGKEVEVDNTDVSNW